MMNHKCGCQVTDAVIFDMDGVIVDSEMLYLNLRWQFAREKNPEVTLEELYPHGGPLLGRKLVPCGGGGA